MVEARVNSLRRTCRFSIHVPFMNSWSVAIEIEALFGAVSTAQDRPMHQSSASEKGLEQK